MLRTKIRGQGAIDAGDGLLVASGLFVWMSKRLPGTVSAFLAMPHEIDLSSLFDRLPRWRWALPRVEPGGSLTFRDSDVPREAHKFGMNQPVDAGPVIPVSEIDLFLTPGLAFDQTGGRLGQGGGFYDRILSEKRPDAISVGVTVEKRVLDRIPMAAFDMHMDFLATETGVRECSPTI